MRWSGGYILFLVEQQVKNLFIRHFDESWKLNFHTDFGILARWNDAGWCGHYLIWQIKGSYESSRCQRRQKWDYYYTNTVYIYYIVLMKKEAHNLLVLLYGHFVPNDALNVLAMLHVVSDWDRASLALLIFPRSASEPMSELRRSLK